VSIVSLSELSMSSTVSPSNLFWEWSGGVFTCPCWENPSWPLQPSCPLHKPLSAHNSLHANPNMICNLRPCALASYTWSKPMVATVRKTLKLKFLFFFIYFHPVEPKCDSKCSQSDHGNIILTHVNIVLCTHLYTNIPIAQSNTLQYM